MAKAADAAGIQWRRLNASKGPAVRATRCQADRGLYRAYIRRAVEAQPNLTIFQSAVDDLLIEPDRSEEHTSELQSLMRISYAVFCLKKKKKHRPKHTLTYIYNTRNKQI